MMYGIAVKHLLYISLFRRMCTDLKGNLLPRISSWLSRLAFFVPLTYTICCVCVCELQGVATMMAFISYSNSNHQTPSELRRRLAILDCQLKKEQQCSKRYQVAVEMLLTFGENAHEALTATLDTGSQPIV